MRATASLSAAQIKHVRRRTIFDFCKWDPQCEDVSVLAPFALLLEGAEWKQLAAAARLLTAEVLAAEVEILSRPELVAMLGLPRKIQNLLARHQRDPVTSGPRVMRFDFHLTTNGWRISEANTDVPGGFIESTGFTQLMSEQHSATSLAGQPADKYADAITGDLSPGAAIALVHATAYTDDRQVMMLLAKSLADRGASPVLVSPENLRWTFGRAAAHVGEACVAIDRIVRFYPAEWLPQLPRSCSWQQFFVGSKTSHSNPATALVSQSKRFPLVWDRLRTNVDAWRHWLPETRDPRHADWRNNPQWVLKTALGRVGDGIALAGVTPPREHAKIIRAAGWWPWHWVAQRRFEALPVETPEGSLFPAIGVFTIDGEPAGIYGRIAAQPLIDHRARDVAVLLNQRADATCDHPTEPQHELRAFV